MMTIKQLLRATVVCATLLGHAHGQSSQLFPALEDTPDELVRLHGLAQLFPGRVLFEDPQLVTTTESRVATRVEDLPREIKYIRVYRLDEAQSVLAEYQTHPALILDLRFLKSELAAVDTFNALTDQAWAQSQLTTVGAVPEDLISAIDASPAPRDTPAIVLCNRETAGPFEATLHQLQQSGAIIAVGEHTAGRTGFYQKTAHQAWILNGELRPNDHTSLVSTGFLPRIQLKINSEENYLSYHLYEAGTPITQLLRQDITNQAELKQEHSDQRELIETDRVLQRGVDIIAALQVLQQQPEL